MTGERAFNHPRVDALVHAAEHDSTVSCNLVGRVHKLSATKGGAPGRHARAIGYPLARCEIRSLEKAVVATIIRAARVAADPDQPMGFVDRSNLPEICP